MSKFWKKSMLVMLSGVLAFGSVIPALADSRDSAISLGADLTGAQKTKVYRLLGVTGSEAASMKSVTVTNKEEKKYLGSYISASKIGTRALSSAIVSKDSSEHSITVKTKNISYVTTGMYENALATVGAKNIHVTVAGPTNISGTAALLGVVKAYEKLSGKEVDEQVIDGAIDEMITTGKLEKSNGADSQKIEGMIADLKEKVAKDDDANIGSEIDKVAKQYNISLTEDQKDQLKKMLEKLSKLDLDVSTLKQQANKVYEKLKDLGVKIDKEQAIGFFQRIINWLKGLFS